MLGTFDLVLAFSGNEKIWPAIIIFLYNLLFVSGIFARTPNVTTDKRS